MIITPEQKPEYFDWASRILSASFEHGGGCKVLTHLYDSGEIAAVVIYSRFHQTNLEMSVASDGARQWISRTFLFHAFAYPFLQLGKQRVMAVVEEDNERALDMNLRLGFVPEGRLRRWFGEKDGILLGMLRDECKWLKMADRKQHV